MMPGMDGPTTFRELRKNPATAHIPLLLLTAKVQSTDQRRFADLGVEAILFKPFDPLTLPAQISDVLRLEVKAPHDSSERRITMDPNGQPALNEALDRMWIQFLPQIKERLDILDSAAAAFAANNLAIELREAASSASHKLAGVLGSFGVTRGTFLARELEIMYSRDGGPDPALGQSLISIAAELRGLIDSRK